MLGELFKRLHEVAGRSTPCEQLPGELSILLHGRDNYPFEVAGCSRWQPDLRTIMQGNAGALQRQELVATLIARAADGSPAVAVMVEGVRVGHFPQYLSTQFREWLSAWQLAHAKVHCHARILAEPAKGEAAPVDYRVKLDIEIPFKMTVIQA